MNISESIDAVLADANHTFSSRFYRNLFLHHPHIVRKFDGVDLKHQGTMLVMALQIMLIHHRQPYPAIVDYLRSLGYRHYQLGITGDDYLQFGTSLQTTLGAFHGPDWSSKLADDWKAAFHGATDVMLQGHVENFALT